jgi:replicative DNA helicase
MYENALSDFFKTIQNHDWITHSHICIYMAIFELWHQNKFTNPVSVSRRTIMSNALKSW